MRQVAMRHNVSHTNARHASDVQDDLQCRKFGQITLSGFEVLSRWRKWLGSPDTSLRSCFREQQAWYEGISGR